jgi:hypothetical protein
VVGATKRRIKLVNLSFQMLVQEQQDFKRPTDVAVTGCDDLVDRGINRLDLHEQSSPHESRVPISPRD